MTTLKELEQRFPYMFEGKNIGISIPKGWMAHFAPMCEQIDAALGDDKQGFHFTQCKEKFGSARWYWSMKGRGQSMTVDIISPDGVTTLSPKPTQEISEQISSIINEAEGKTQTACIVCGKEGKPDRGTGWVLVLCHEHQAKRAANQLEQFWDEE